MKSVTKSVLIFILFCVILLNTLSAKACKLGFDYFNGENSISYIDYDTIIKWKVNDTFSDSSRKFIGINYNGIFYPIGEEIEVDGDAIFTLVWQPCTVVLDYGYEGAQPEELSVDYYKSIVLPSASREGYTFEGWSDYWDDLHEAGEEVRITNIDTTFTAIWTKIPDNPIITLEYGFDNKSEQFEIKYGSDYVIPSEVTRPGYKLTEWKMKESYGFYRPGEKLSNVKGSLTLVAKWEEAKYTVKFDFDYKTKSNKQSATQKKYKETVVMPEVDEQDGWNFIGWADGKNTYKQGETVVIEDDVVFTALWEETLTKIELYTEWLNKEEPVLTSQIIQAIQNREIEFKVDSFEFGIKGANLKLSFDGGDYTAYFDGTDNYIVTTTKNENIAFKVKRENGYSTALALVNLLFNKYFYPLYSGKFIGSYLTDDLDIYYEVYKCDSSEWAYCYNYDKLVKVATYSIENVSGMISTESYSVSSFKEFGLQVDDSSVKVGENYKVISSRDSNLKLENLYGFSDADEVTETNEGTLTLIE